MVPPLRSMTDDDYEYATPIYVQPPLRIWVRLALIAIALGLGGVFATAVHLDPYKDGKVWYEETHKQLGLAACTFKVRLGVPCPSCGMTTSFALLMHGDLLNSLRANAVGTMLALFGLVVLPWSLVSAVLGRTVLVRRLEPLILKLIVLFLSAALLRWGIVLLTHVLG